MHYPYNHEQSNARDSTGKIEISVALSDGSSGYLVIDSTYHNSSSGGLRIAGDLTLEEVRALAREMTLKYSFIGLRRGGAKSGIRFSSALTGEKKGELLREFGRVLAPVIRTGLYSPWGDMGCSTTDLQAVYAGAGLNRGPSSDSSFFTGISAYDALEACRESMGVSAPVSLSIEGFGSVARWLAQRLQPGRFLITAISTVNGAVANDRGFSLGELAEKTRQYGDDVVDHLEGDRGPRESLFQHKADIFVPSARTFSVTAGIASRIDVKFIVPVANAPYGQGAVPLLHSRGTVCLPAFVVNSGGVFGSTLYDSGASQRRIEELSAGYFRPVVRALVRCWTSGGVSPVSVGEDVATRRLSMRSDPVQSQFQRAASYAVSAAGRLVPRAVGGRATLAGFRNSLIGLEEMIRKTGGIARPA
jgi:glutamate dehydrogenase (NAD(P)+)